MSANFDHEDAGPFDGPFDAPSSSPRGYDAPAQSEFGGDYGGMDDVAAAEQPRSSGLEVVGGALFLAGFIPAAAVAKALLDGTNLEAPGLGGTAALAATVSKWLGAWPALVTAALIGILGSLMVLGTLRTDPLRRVAGIAVSGLGLAAIVGALTSSPVEGLLGAGGRIGSGTGGAMADALGAWAGVLLGLAVIGGALWLGFGPSDTVVDEDDGLGPIIERGESAPRSAGAAAGSAVAWAAGAAASVGAAAAAAGAGLLKRQPRSDSEVVGSRGDRQRRVSNKKVRRSGAPVTLGDALARRGTEGVSHDEAAALAPDDKTLAYMEDVWRRASDSVEQPEPIPKSPYPEDVRLKGMIPEGAAPLAPRRPAGDADHTTPGAQGAPGQQTQPQPAQPQAPMQPPVLPVPPAPMPYYGGSEGAAQDVAPFDFEDELSPPQPLNSTPPPATQSAPLPNAPSHAADPFVAPSTSGELTSAEAEAYRDAVLREGASTQGPSDLPAGVQPFTPKPAEGEVAPPAPIPSPPQREEPAASHVASDPVLPDVPSVTFSKPESAGADPMAKQAMQAGAMPASVSLPPRPAWEQGYDDDEPSAELESELMESIPEVDETGRWQRRDGADGLEGAESVGADSEEGDALSESSMSVLDQLLAQVDAEEVATAEEPEAVETAPAAELAADPVETVGSYVKFEAAAPATEEAELDDDEEEAAELELDAELTDDVDASEAEAEEDSGEEADAEEGAEEEEYEEDDYEEDGVEEAELEDGEEEEEYEYVDEDGNPIDPADLSEEYEFVDEDDEEEDEEAEYEEYDEDEDEDEDEEAAEYEEQEDPEEDPEAELEEPEEDPEEEAAEYEEVDEDAEYEDAEAAEYEDAEASEDSGESEDEVVLAPQPPPEAAPAAESAAESTAESAPEAPISKDGSRLREAGRLVVSVDRAAVSVIQKGFDVEFAEACSILEELHAEGLIGPYQEGKKRAILMSLDEWDGRFAHS